MQLALVAGLVAVGATAEAATYTQISDPTSISGSASIETFESYATGTTVLPLTSGIMTVSSGNASGVAVVSDFYDHPGTPVGSQWIGNTANAVSYTFDFTAGISQFGLVLYGHQFAGTTMELFDAASQSLTSFVVPIGGPNGNEGQYTGFTSDMDLVRSVVIEFGGVDAVWADNISYLDGTVSPVPVPASLPMLLVSVGAIAVAHRHRRG